MYTYKLDRDLPSFITVAVLLVFFFPSFTNSCNTGCGTMTILKNILYPNPFCFHLYSLSSMPPPSPFSPPPCPIPSTYNPPNLETPHEIWSSQPSDFRNAQFNSIQIELNWFELNELNWIEWTEYNWIELNWIEMLSEIVEGQWRVEKWQNWSQMTKKMYKS